MKAIIPDLIPVPDDATPETVAAVRENYLRNLVAINPLHFLPLGVKKRWYHFRLEHPLTKENPKRVTSKILQ